MKRVEIEIARASLVALSAVSLVFGAVYYVGEQAFKAIVHPGH